MSQQKEQSRTINNSKLLETPKGFPGIGTRSPMVLRQGGPVNFPNGNDTGFALAAFTYKARLVKALRERLHMTKEMVSDEKLLSISKGTLLRAGAEASLAFEDFGKAMIGHAHNSKIKRLLNKMGIYL